MGIPAVRRMLQSHPNPEGLPTDMIIKALKICLEENFCEFCGEKFKVNSGTAMGPFHSCDYALMHYALIVMMISPSSLKHLRVCILI